MVQDSLKGGEQYYSVSDPQLAVVQSWINISNTLHQTLVLSMSLRCIEVP